MFPLYKRQLECIQGESGLIPWTHCVISGLPPVDSLLYILTRCNLVEPLKWSHSGGAKSHSRTPEGSEFIFASRLGLLPLEHFHQTSPECVHSVVFAATTHPQPPALICSLSKLLWDTAVRQALIRQANRIFFAIRPTNMHTPSHTRARRPYRSSGRWVWSCDKLSGQIWGYPWRASLFSSPILSFDATFVINSDKSSSSSPLMCARHIARTHKHTSLIHHPQ